MFRYIAISLQAQTTHTGLRLETSVLTAQIQISQDEMPLMEQVLHRWAVGGGAFDFAFGTFGVGGTLRTMDLVSSLNHDLHHQKQNGQSIKDTSTTSLHLQVAMANLMDFRVPL